MAPEDDPADEFPPTQDEWEKCMHPLSGPELAPVTLDGHTLDSDEQKTLIAIWGAHAIGCGFDCESRVGTFFVERHALFSSLRTKGLIYLTEDDEEVQGGWCLTTKGDPIAQALVDQHGDYRAVGLACDDLPPPAPVAESIRPIDMLLECPRCQAQHVDAPEPETGWTNPPHKSHLCVVCKTVWRPADIATNGVAAITTRGKKDTWPTPPTPPTPRVPTCKCDRCGKQLYADSCGNYRTDAETGRYAGVCYACLRPEED